jgi:hypothetical protein
MVTLIQVILLYIKINLFFLILITLRLPKQYGKTHMAHLVFRLLNKDFQQLEMIYLHSSEPISIILCLTMTTIWKFSKLLMVSLYIIT